MNVPRTIATVMSSGRATMAELNTILSVEDVHDILEVLTVDAMNAETLRKKG